MNDLLSNILFVKQYHHLNAETLRCWDLFCTALSTVFVFVSLVRLAYVLGKSTPDSSINSAV